MRLLKVILALLVAAFLGLAGYAYLGDMGARQAETRQSVPLDLGARPSASGTTAPEAATESPAAEAVNGSE